MYAPSHCLYWRLAVRLWEGVSRGTKAAVNGKRCPKRARSDA